MSEFIGKPASVSDSKPETSRHWRYVNGILDAQSGQHTEWLSQSGGSRIIVESKRIRASMAGEAFENYTKLTVSDKHDLEDVTQKVMHALNTAKDHADMRVLINNVPLLFANDEDAIIGQRNHRGTSIQFESDKLSTPLRKQILVGGLATILYYADFPADLQRVE